jgi:hypothetical protein
LDSGRASSLEQTSVEKPCRTPKDSDRASALELGGGLPIGRESLRPSEPHHSPNKATPSYYTKNESFCDRTTSEMRGLSPKIILGDFRQSENAQTHTHKHTIRNMKFNLKLLQIKCHVLEFTTDKAQKVLQRINRVFAEAFVSQDRHTLFTLEESEPPRTTYTCESR